MNYYKIIDGKKMDSNLLEMAEKSVLGAGDGRISRNDAESLLNKVKDSGVYTEIEKNTMEYIRDNFKWTDSADDWFRAEIARWAVTK